MSKSKVSLYSGILFLVYGSFLLIGSLLIKNSGLTTLGAGFIPKLISIAIIVLSAILVIQSFFEIKLTKGQDDNLTQIEKTDKKTVLMTIAILIIYVALIKPIGFIIMSIPYLFCQMLLLEKNKLCKNKIIIFMIIAVATPFIINFIFSKFFTLMLPQGILG